MTPSLGVLAVLDLEDEPDITPHPSLVAAKKPSPREVAEVASLLGWLPGYPLFPIAAINRSEEE